MCAFVHSAFLTILVIYSRRNPPRGAPLSQLFSGKLQS